MEESSGLDRPAEERVSQSDWAERAQSGETVTLDVPPKREVSQAFIENLKMAGASQYVIDMAKSNGERNTDRAELFTKEDLVDLLIIVDDTSLVSRLESLPSELTQREIRTLGVRLSNLIELVSPSRDGVSHGAKRERAALVRLAGFSMQRGDRVTARSIERYLGNSKQRRNRIAAKAINDQLAKSYEET